MGWFFTALKWVGSLFSSSGALSYFTDMLEKNKDAETERERIRADYAKAQIAALTQDAANQRSIIMRAMDSKLFWIPWLIATVPIAAWFGWGALDSLIANGAILPDVAALPPQLKEYADTVWANLFYTGGGLAGVRTIVGGVGAIMERRRA